MVSRAERSPFADWWWTIDRWLLASIAGLMVLGLVLTLAGSPPVAERLGLPTFHFVNRQVGYLLPALAVMIGTSFLSPRLVRRAALVIFIISLALVIGTLFFGQEVKGAKRWIFGIQPSEFLKPSFVVVVAWAFSEGARRKDVPGNWLALLLFPLTIGPLVLQPADSLWSRRASPINSCRMFTRASKPFWSRRRPWRACRRISSPRPRWKASSPAHGSARGRARAR